MSISSMPDTVHDNVGKKYNSTFYGGNSSIIIQTGDQLSYVMKIELNNDRKTQQKARTSLPILVP